MGVLHGRPLYAPHIVGGVRHGEVIHGRQLWALFEAGALLGAKKQPESERHLCTPQGETIQYNICGSIEHAWLFTEGKHTKLDLWKVKGAPIDTSFRLEGQWQQGDLVLKDNGSLGKAFRADGSVQPKGIYGAKPIKNEQADVNVAYGSKLDFDELCANEIVKK